MADPLGGAIRELLRAHKELDAAMENFSGHNASYFLHNEYRAVEDAESALEASIRELVKAELQNLLARGDH